MLRLKTTEQRRLLEREQTSSESDCEAPAKLRPLHTVPPYLYKTETIQRFQNRVREAFLSGDRGRARVYLQSVVDHIVIGEDEIVIEAKAVRASARSSPRGRGRFLFLREAHGTALGRALLEGEAQLSKSTSLP